MGERQPGAVPARPGPDSARFGAAPLAQTVAAAGAIRTAMILGLVFIETLVLFTLAIVFVKVGY